MNNGLSRNPFGQKRDATTPTKPGRKAVVRTDLTHVYWTETGQRASLRGMRCKVISERTNGRFFIEFENGRREVVQKRSLKKLPERKLDS